MNHQGASEDRRSTSSNAAANPFRIGQGFAKTVYGLFQCLFRGIRHRFGAPPSQTAPASPCALPLNLAETAQRLGCEGDWQLEAAGP
jgi:hypothetical protein